MHVGQVKNCSYAGLHCYLYQNAGFGVKKNNNNLKRLKMLIW